MENINENKCPKCGNENLIDTGSRIGNVAALKQGEKIPTPHIPIMECKKCDNRYKLMK
jgi:DNA-directed RNA polymerase subunit M/transcription elongation factor TFIIS